MNTAKVKYPYKKEWEKDLGYGLSAPITLENEEIGEYKQYVNATDPKKQWIRELKKGDQVFLELNPNGNGYIIKQTAAEKSSEMPTMKASKPIDNKLQVKNSAQILGDCIKEIELQLKEANTQFTSEDVRCLAISMFIQIMRTQKNNFDYSFN